MIHYRMLITSGRLHLLQIYEGDDGERAEKILGYLVVGGGDVEGALLHSIDDAMSHFENLRQASTK